ncbi:hypothetical protein [Chitinophaga sp.]|uniref:hypothetical protein n=1 Tax=Chitinophaga sp. TaxID=1869181 RepID=UPI0031E03D43
MDIRGAWPFLIGLGIVLFNITKDSSRNLVFIFALLVLLAGLCGIYFASSNRVENFRRNWLIIESGTDILIAGVALYFYIRSSNLTGNFNTAFAYFALAFAFMQLIYIFQILQIGRTLNLNIMLARCLMAVGYGIFGIILIFNAAQQSASTFMINLIGIGPLLAGLFSLAFSGRMYMLRKSVSE